MQTHGGGVRDPLIIHWPGRIKEGGQISSQFCHCSDIVPTILEACNVEPPEWINGVQQLPVSGTSLVYTFQQPHAAQAKRIQYFELMGNRGIWSDGWKAVTRHFEGDAFEDDQWELYHLASDFSESRNLAENHPDKLQELVSLWWGEAERNKVLPLDDRNLDRVLLTYFAPLRRRWTFEQGMNRVSGYAAPTVGNRSYRITADVEIQGSTEGIILSAGGQAGGYVLFMQDGHLVHEYVGPDRHWVLESEKTIPLGRHELAFDFRWAALNAGIATLLCDGRPIASSPMESMWPGTPSSGGVCCGYDEGSRVSHRYLHPFSFTGVIHSVVVEASDYMTRIAGLENHIAMAED
jgi:arylsulfatase